MSKCTPRDQKFIDDVNNKAKRILTCWAEYVECRYDAGPCSKKDYILRAHHCWGTSQCHWEHHKEELMNALKEAGATGVIGKVGWNRVDLAFDITQKRLKEDGLIEKKPSGGLSVEEKMDLWHEGKRKENIRACSKDKLIAYRDCCNKKGYTYEAYLLNVELLKFN